MRLIEASPSISPPRFGLLLCDTALTSHQTAIHALKDTAGISNILYGSDANFAPDVIVGFDSHQLMNIKGFSEEELSSIFQNNALNLFPRFNQIKSV